MMQTRETTGKESKQIRITIPYILYSLVCMKGLLFVVVADIYNGSRQQKLEDREQVYKVYISIVD